MIIKSGKRKKFHIPSYETFLYTDGIANAAGLWTGWTETHQDIDGHAPTLSNVLIPELSSIVGATSQRILYVGGVGDFGGQIILHSPNTPVGSFAPGDYGVFSFWARSQTGVTGIDQVCPTITARNANGDLISRPATTEIGTLLTTSWSKFSVTLKLTGVNRVSVELVSYSIDPGDTLDVEIAFPQVSKL